MECNKLYTRRELSKRMQNYYIRTGQYSGLTQLEYIFLKHLYMYLTKQQTSMEFKEELYTIYTKLIDITYSMNRPEPCPRLQDAIYKHLDIILESEYHGPVTFIMLNSTEHYKKMQKAIRMLKVWGTNPLYSGYASEDEFWEAMNFLRKQFSYSEINFYNEVGKWPRKFRKRFRRKL